MPTSHSPLKPILARFLTGSLKQILLVTMALGILLPVLFVVSSSLKSKTEYVFNPWGLPQIPTLANFQTAIVENNLLRWMENSALLTISSVLVATLVASFAAYGIARHALVGGQIIFGAIISLIVIPSAVLIIPLFKLMARLGLLNQYASAFLIYVGVMLPFSIFLLTSFFRTIPSEMVDAARIDGCGSMQVFFYIVLPVSMPALVTTVAVNWIYVWNEMLIALIFLQKDQMRTLMAGLSLFKGKYSINVPLLMAGVMFSIVPTLTVYVFGQRYFIRGLTAGSTKG